MIGSQKTIKTISIESDPFDSTVWRSIHTIDAPEYGQSNSCLNISADSLFIRDIIEAVTITHDDYYIRKKRYTYDPTPSAGDDSYNSNSYTAGILTAAGVTDIPDPTWYQPGLDKPLPIRSTHGDLK